MKPTYLKIVKVWAVLLTTSLWAHEISFNSSMTYSDSRPAISADAQFNWTGASFDADNIGGSGVNLNGGNNNGTANDAYTYVANNQPSQGQSFTTGTAAYGYQLHGLTVQIAGYTDNQVSSSNRVAWNLDEENGPIILALCKIDGTERKLVSMQNFKAGDIGNPGNGSSANGPGTYITFHLPFTTLLKPETTYGFELRIGNGGSNYFEWLGTRDTGAYNAGTAYQPNGDSIEPLSGNRVFIADMTALPDTAMAFAHPGTLHTQEDLDRMKAKVEAEEEPWLSGYEMLLSSPYNNLGWPAYDVEYIVRGDSGNNYTRSQQDAQLIYTLALIWHLTGDTAYADRAVEIANVWSDLKGISGNSNASLAAGICGYLFAIGGELLSTYPGWEPADRQAYQDMMMRVFYPANFDFLWRHHDTFFNKGGNTHYRLNWDTANMASMAAIGVLCDNRAVYEQALDYFKYGSGNGRIERAAWYIHPNGLAQSEESGRDQGHNLGGWHAMALLCQMAWNQGDDLFGYDNNRALRAFEYNAKYNLDHSVPWVYHRNTSLTGTESLSSAGRGIEQYYQYELIYNHYVNVKGMAAPWSKLAAEATRPEPWPNTGHHPSQVDWLGLGTLTYTRDDIEQGTTPSGLQAQWSKNQVILNWFGTAGATCYLIQRATGEGEYVILGTSDVQNLSFIDADVGNETVYTYIVTAQTPSGQLDSEPLCVAQEWVSHYSFDGHAQDEVGGRDAELHGGSTGLPTYVAGFDGRAISLDGVDDYVQLPVGIANTQDLTIATWVYWQGGSDWERIFDFGSEIEKYMFLSPQSSSDTCRFQMTTSRNTDGSLTLDGPVLPKRQWIHVAVTLNGDTGTLYINGVPVDSDVVDEVDPLFSQIYCYLGRSMWNADPLFKGRIDDFRIYNFALSGAEVWYLWGQGSGDPPTFLNNPIREANAVEGEAYSGQLQSLVDANRSYSLTKVTGPDWLRVAIDGALSGTPDNEDVGDNLFVVRSTDMVGASDDANLWITVENVNLAPVWNNTTLTKAEATTLQAYSESLADDVHDADVNDVVSFAKLSGPDWLKVATDGTLSGTPTLSDQGENIFVVRATDSAANDSDVTVIISVQGQALVSYYGFDASLIDSVGGYTAIAPGRVSYTDGKEGQAVQFDGDDFAVTLPDDHVLGSLTDMTIALWIYWSGGDNWQRIFDFGNDTSQYLFLTPKSGSNTLRFAIKDGGSEQILETSRLSSDTWLHVAIVLDGDEGRLYVDGSLADTGDVDIDPADFAPQMNYLGDSQYEADPLYEGLLDELRFYNYALSLDEIEEIAGTSSGRR